MKLFTQKVKKHWFSLSVFCILFLAFILRTYNFLNRIGLGSDSMRDVIVAQIALQRHELPLIGSFSSAGPFVFGPLYFWFNMLGLSLMPFSFKTPWILMDLVGILTVAVMMVVGYRIGGRRLCIILGLITAFCPQFISRSTGLTQHSLVGITTSLLLLFFILLYQAKKKQYAFLMGLAIGTALSMHYQALNLLIFLPTPFIIPKMSLKNRLLSFLLMCVGFLIPSLPLLYWDAHQGFANIRNVMDYIFIAQYRIYVANSWKIYLFKFLPDYWSNVVGGNKPVAAVIMAVTFLVFVYQTLKRKIPGEVFILGIIFGILMIIIRYYRGERFDGYMIYVAPFMFLLSSWALLELFTLLKKSRFITKRKILYKYFALIGSLIFCAILVSDLKNASQFIFVKNYSETEVTDAKTTLLKKYPGEKFQLYDYYWKSSDMSYLLGEQLREEGKISKNGIPIGVIYTEFPICPPFPTIYTSGGWRVISLQNFSAYQIQRPEWGPVNPDDVYDDLITRWQKDQKLTSSFSPIRFIQEKLGIR